MVVSIEFYNWLKCSKLVYLDCLVISGIFILLIFLKVYGDLRRKDWKIVGKS